MMIDMITCELTVTALNRMKVEMFISNRPHHNHGFSNNMALLTLQYCKFPRNINYHGS